jgi:hypothetical protein
MKKLNILRALSGAPLSALILPLVLAGFLASCDDGYLPMTPHITFDRDTLYLDDLDEDDNLIPLTITVSIPSKLINTFPRYRVILTGLKDEADISDIDKVTVSITSTTAIDNGDNSYDITETTNFYVTPDEGVITFTIYVDVYKLIEIEDGDTEREEPTLVTSEVTITVELEKPR